MIKTWMFFIAWNGNNISINADRQSSKYLSTSTRFQEGDRVITGFHDKT